MSQAAVATAMGTVPSVLSKLQRSELIEPEVANKYLEAVGSPLAAEVREFYSREWRAFEPPSFMHPDREVLWRIDGASVSLADFEKSRKYRPILRGPIDLLKGELHSSLQYLLRRDHTIVWVGDIGVGKTTALAFAVGLLVGDGRTTRKPAFPVGSGRTTICETEVRVSPTFGVAVETVSDEDVLKLTRDLVSALAPGAAGVGVPAEVNRSLRNMADMRVRRVPIGNDEFQSVDPIQNLLAEGLTVDEAVDRVVAAMRLGERKERQALLPEGSLDGLNWLSTLVSKINNGQDERFGIPRRITVLIPSPNLAADGQVLSVVDTRGVEGTTQRPDLIEHRDDARALVVLCSKFADAPGTTATRFLEDTRNAGSDAASLGRLCLLVLPRGDEALLLPGLDEPVSSRGEGYAVRKQDVSQAFVKAKVSNTPVYFFDAHNDDPARIWQQLRAQVAQMRKAYSERALEAVSGVENLIDNVDLVKTSEARRKIEADADLLLGQVHDLPGTVRAPYLNLLDQLEATHSSSIAASIVRGGDWQNFDIASILGMGVRIDTNKRIEGHISRIEFKLQEFEAEHAELRDVVESVKGLRALVTQGRQELLTTAHSIGRDAFGSLIGRTREIWALSEERYGGGPGYKREIAGYWREFFESGADDQVEAKKAIDGRLQKAWQQTVLDKLKASTRVEAEGT